MFSFLPFARKCFPRLLYNSFDFVCLVCIYLKTFAALYFNIISSHLQGSAAQDTPRGLCPTSAPSSFHRFPT